MGDRKANAPGSVFRHINQKPMNNTRMNHYITLKSETFVINSKIILCN